MPIVAEGVETQEQRQMLLDEGCPQAQGYYFGRPAADPFQAEAWPLDLPEMEKRDAEG